VPHDHNLAENDPEKFATMIIDRLQRIKDEETKLERIQEAMKNIEVLLCLVLSSFCHSSVDHSFIHSFVIHP